jgi:hypothetical protein
MKFSYSRRLCSLLFSLLLLSLAPHFSFAQFTSLNKVYKIVNHATGKVLDVDYYGHYQTIYGVFMRDYSGSASQQWKFAPSRASGTGVYEVINRSSAKVLSATCGCTGSSVTQNDRYNYNGTPVNTQQLWQFRKLPGIQPYPMKSFCCLPTFGSPATQLFLAVQPRTIKALIIKAHRVGLIRSGMS